MATGITSILRYCLIVLGLLLVAPGCDGQAHAATTVRVLETYPAGDSATLPIEQRFRMRLAYASDEPIGIWLKLRFQGREVPYAGTSPSGLYRGEGEAQAWFFFMREGAQVDEIQVLAGDGRINPVAAVYRAHITAEGASAGSEPPPAWVVEADAREAAAAKQRSDAHDASREASPVELAAMVLGGISTLSVLGLGAYGFVLVLRKVWRWGGGWRVAAAVPGAIMSFVVLRIVIDGVRDPTSHNLWPFEIVIVGLVCAVLLGMTFVLHWLTGDDS